LLALVFQDPVCEGCRGIQKINIGI
jgi:hypothetical protein